MALAKSMLVVKAERLDTDPWLLNCANGTVDLRTGTLKAHRPEDYITRVVPVNYTPDAAAPVFKRHWRALRAKKGRPSSRSVTFCNAGSATAPPARYVSISWR